jgi:uncharacterized lipoprotein YehR (DUF1307 family)
MQNLHSKVSIRERFEQQEHILQEDEDVDKIEDSQGNDQDEMQNLFQRLVYSDKSASSNLNEILAEKLKQHQLKTARGFDSDNQKLQLIQ